MDDFVEGLRTICRVEDSPQMQAEHDVIYIGDTSLYTDEEINELDKKASM